jgi:hypothetical protein
MADVTSTEQGDRISNRGQSVDHVGGVAGEIFTALEKLDDKGCASIIERHANAKKKSSQSNMLRYIFDDRWLKKDHYSLFTRLT